MKNGVFRLFLGLSGVIEPLSNKAILYHVFSRLVSLCLKKSDAGYNTGYNAKSDIKAPALALKTGHFRPAYPGCGNQLFSAMTSNPVSAFPSGLSPFRMGLKGAENQNRRAYTIIRVRNARHISKSVLFKAENGCGRGLVDKIYFAELRREFDDGLVGLLGLEPRTKAL